MRDFFDLKFHCVLDDRGNAQCHNTDPSIQGEDEKSELETQSEGGDSNSHNGQKVCSGSCLNPDDCDIKSDCLCASTKGIP